MRDWTKKGYLSIRDPNRWARRSISNNSERVMIFAGGHTPKTDVMDGRMRSRPAGGSRLVNVSTQNQGEVAT